MCSANHFSVETRGYYMHSFHIDCIRFYNSTPYVPCWLCRADLICFSPPCSIDQNPNALSKLATILPPFSVGSALWLVLATLSQPPGAQVCAGVRVCHAQATIVCAAFPLVSLRVLIFAGDETWNDPPTNHALWALCALLPLRESPSLPVHSNTLTR